MEFDRLRDQAARLLDGPAGGHAAREVRHVGGPVVGRLLENDRVLLQFFGPAFFSIEVSVTAGKRVCWVTGNRYRPRFRASLRRVPDFNGHLLAERCQRGLDLHCLRGVLRIEHAADDSFVDTEAAGQFGVVDPVVAHREI